MEGKLVARIAHTRRRSMKEESGGRDPSNLIGGKVVEEIPHTSLLRGKGTEELAAGIGRALGVPIDEGIEAYPLGRALGITDAECVLFQWRQKLLSARGIDDI